MNFVAASLRASGSGTCRADGGSTLPLTISCKVALQLKYYGLELTRSWIFSISKKYKFFYLEFALEFRPYIWRNWSTTLWPSLSFQLHLTSKSASKHEIPKFPNFKLAPLTLSPPGDSTLIKPTRWWDWLYWPSLALFRQKPPDFNVSHEALDITFRFFRNLNFSFEKYRFLFFNPPK